ncbi:serine/threonine protein kinase [Cellulosimicrobium sp. MI9406]|uniref:serine/threonine-protein kinase n=1 Tax=Cellulosimicrobium sp. MI9406 TaxID=2931398 RepID=UPI0033B1E46B
MLLGDHLTRPTYRILQTIGEGNQGVCRKAYHEVFECEMVQKTIATIGAPDSAVRTSEPALLNRIRHDRIVTVNEAQWDPDSRWSGLGAITFVMPYYEEGSVYGALIDGHRFSVRQATQIAIDVLDGLHHMHAVHGLVHRDVKPANVLLEDGKRRGCLADLGSAAYIDPSTGGASSQMVTPLYQAPEAGPAGVTTALGDVYAVGVMMIEMLNGRFPYETIDEVAVDARLGAGQRALDDRSYEPEFWVPRPLATAIRAMCNVDPEKRPRTAADALRTLQSLRVVDWARTSGDGHEGVWIGYWPPEARRESQRVTEVTVTTLASGRDAGKLEAAARWRRPNGPWRNYAQLKDRFDAGDRPALARFFRRVDAKAQSAPT